jgi:mannose-1-phosphate guanylyltransferase
VARLAGEHAEAVRPNRRFHVDFQQVLARVNDAELFARPILITNADFRFVVAEQLRECGIEADIVLEPERVVIPVSPLQSPPCSRLVLVLAADHVVRKPDEFREVPAGGNGRGQRQDRHLRHRAHPSGDELRLHPSRRKT